MSRRTEKLSSHIRRIVATEILSGLADPRIAPVTSVTRVEVSADLGIAKVYISVAGDEIRARLSMEALKHATGHMQTTLARRLTLRQCPRLQFQLDESLKKGFKIVQLIDREMAILDARSRAAESDHDAPRIAPVASEPRTVEEAV